MKFWLVALFSVLAMNSFAETMKLTCEGHTAFRRRTCEVQVNVDTQSSNSMGNMEGSGKIKCYDRQGEIIHEGSLTEFCYMGMPNGAFELEAQAPIRPFEVPAQKAIVKIDMSSNSKKVNATASYYSGTVFKEMPMKCEFK